MGVKRALRRWFRTRKARAASSNRLGGFAAWQRFNERSERTERLIAELAKTIPTDLRFTFVLPASVARVARTLESLFRQSYPNFEIILLEAESGGSAPSDDRVRRLAVPADLSPAS